jgi:hypothetical protein
VHIIPRITAEGGRVLSVGAGRDIQVSASSLRLLDQCGITPPAPGTRLSLQDVNAAMEGAELTVPERMALKAELRQIGLLTLG